MLMLLLTEYHSYTTATPLDQALCLTARTILVRRYNKRITEGPLPNSDSCDFYTVVSELHEISYADVGRGGRYVSQVED